MFRMDDKKGAIAFLFIVLICLAGAVAAYRISGHMGIEERFHQALGLDAGEHGEGEEGGLYGFAIEGDTLLYLASVLILGIAALAMYARHWR